MYTAAKVINSELRQAAQGAIITHEQSRKVRSASHAVSLLIRTPCSPINCATHLQITRANQRCTKNQGQIEHVQAKYQPQDGTMSTQFDTGLSKLDEVIKAKRWLPLWRF